ncbi:MAG: hypothetical protein QXW83_00570 [Nitrososphaerales archaeon]
MSKYADMRRRRICKRCGRLIRGVIKRQIKGSGPYIYYKHLTRDGRTIWCYQGKGLSEKDELFRKVSKLYHNLLKPRPGPKME